MNRVILAYSQLRGQLPAAVRARWRARLTPNTVTRLVTAQPVTRLLRQSVPASVALAP